MEKLKTDTQVRTESIRQMEQTVTGLFTAAGQSGDASTALVKAMRQALSARCVTCSLELTGNELYLLARPAQEVEGNRILRLRQNRCAREGCESNFYKLTFKSDEQVDWEKLFAQAKDCQKPAETEPEPEAVLAQGASIPRHRSVPSRTTLVRAGVLAGAVLLLAVWHQVYFGGRIPFLRQPEKFRVAVSTDSDDAHVEKTAAKPVVSTPQTRVSGGSDDK